MRCLVSSAPVQNPLFHLAFADTARKQFVYLDPRTSPVINGNFQPVPARVLADADRLHEFRVHLSAPAELTLSEIVYPGWTAKVDGRSVTASSFAVGGTPVFPRVAVPAGTHVLSYSWSGWPS